jgi:hypothetical protein
VLCCAVLCAACDVDQGFACFQCMPLAELAVLAAKSALKTAASSPAPSRATNSSAGGLPASNSSAASPSPSPRPAGLNLPMPMAGMPMGRRLLQAGADSSSCPVGFYASSADSESKPAGAPGLNAAAAGAPKGCSACPEGSTTAGPGARTAEDCSGW